MQEEWLSSLSASLLVLGLGLFVLVVAFNFFEARRAGLPLRLPRLPSLSRRRPAAGPSSGESAESVQEAFEDAEADLASQSATGVSREAAEPAVEDAGSDAPASASDAAEADHSAEPSVREPLDPRFELIVDFSGTAPLSPMVEKLLARFIRVQTKPVRSYLDAQTGVVQVGMVLATRSGFASLIEIEEFLDQSERLMLPYGLRRIGPRPDSAQAMARAREVDMLLGRLDGQICFHLKASRLPSWSDVDGVMAALGLEVRGDGHYARLDGDGALRYVIMPADEGLFLSLLLDLPRVHQPAVVLAQMVEDAQSIAQAFEAELVDDRGMPLLAPALQMMGAQVGARAEQLQAVGLVPGSLLACRLFS
ncbi:MAG: cell division protein ZipA C-terminal FtsZ-binding domain-containing protein [Burkholderiaceae bacterium]